MIKNDTSVLSRPICHPATAVMLWLFFMVWVMLVGVPVLAGVSGAIALGFTQNTRQQFVRYLRRSRWLLLVLLLVHAYSLPGAPLWPVLGTYGPSQVGVSSGLLQSWRLMLVLALLAVLMTRLTREAILAGIYTLMAPLKFVGLEPERMAVRVWLTMRYAEVLMQDAQQVTFRQRLQQLSSPPAVTGDMMQPLLLAVYRPRWLDYVCITSVVMLGMWVK